MIRVIEGDCRDGLKALPDASVQCCVTSPPYFGLRDYGTAKWDGGDAECDHRKVVDPIAAVATSTLGGGKKTTGHLQEGDRTCRRCGAVRIDSQIGLEASPDLFVAEMVAVFREVRRVLRDDGTLWLNLGDSYSSGMKGANNNGEGGSSLTSGARPHIRAAYNDGRGREARPVNCGLPDKNLMMVPARVALALQADGWWLRSDIIWAKKNCMPESVTDRPSSAHEHVFLLAKSQRYFYDAEAIREEGVIPAGTRAAKGSNIRSELKDVNGRPPEYWDYTGTRNSRNVWSIATKPFADAHFATFPPELAERCIKAGTSEKGCCAACGAPWARTVTRTMSLESGSGKSGIKPEGKGAGGAQKNSGTYDIRMGPVVSSTTTGWGPTCACEAAVVPCTVLDPFAGAFTSLLVADRLQRDGIGIELNPAYAEMARKRLTNDAPLFAEVAG